MEIRDPGSALVPRVIFKFFLYCAAVPLVAPLYLCAQQVATSSSPPEYDLKEYAAQLDRCAEAIKTPAEIHQLKSSLPPAWSVRSEKTTFEVSTEPITSKLRELEVHPNDSDKIIRDLNLRLSAMRKAAADMEASERRLNAGPAKERMDKILAGREFQGAKGPSAMDRLVARINRWLTEHLVRLFMRLHISSKTGNTLAWAVMILAFLALCGMVWRWLTDKSRAPESEPAPKAVPSDTRQWVNEALAAGERGDFREAIRCAYWAAVAKLEDIHVLARDRARTPRESLRLLEHHPNEQRLLRDLTSHFELIWYGYRPASPGDWSLAKEQLEKMGCLKASTALTANS
jgi:hypothetical protein